MNRSLSLLNQNDFIIMVNEMQFTCNTAAVNSSNVILKLRNEDPNLKKYEYKYDGNPEDFQPICDFFNFKEITITMENMDSLLQIANDFQINSIIELIRSIHKCDDIYDLLTQKCDNINEIFESLYQINQISVETVKQTILKSIWIHSEDNIKELIAVFLQVLGMRLNLHENIIELLISLDKSATKENDLHLLLPNMIKMLKLDSHNGIYDYLFIYKMIKKGFFEIEEFISFNVSKQITSSIVDPYFCLVFFPEIIEFRKITLDTLYYEMRNKKDQLYILKYYGQIGIDRFKKIRDSGEPEDELSRAILHDDVDKLQSLVSINIQDINTKFIPINLFDPFGNTVQTSYLNFACECGSIKCVKYLLLNHADVDQLTFGFAILGNNSEIIHIIDQHNKNTKKVMNPKTFSTWPQNLKNPIELTILLHQYDLFDWMFENNFSQNNLNEKSLIDLLKITFSCGNLYAFIRLIERNQNLNTKKINLKQWLTNAAVRGFYRQMKILCIVFDCSESIQKVEMSDHCPILFGNFSIFQFFFDKKNPSFDYSMQLLYAIKYDYFNIMKYIFDELYQPQEYQTLINVYSAMIQSKSKIIIDFLEEKYDFIKIIQLKEFILILMDLISIIDIENCRKIIDIIIEKDSFLDFTDQFLNAALINNNEICQCFLDKKVTIDLNKTIRNCLKNINTSEEILYKLIDRCNPFEKDLFIQIIFNEAIINNIKMAKNLIKYKPSINNQSLFHAVSSHDEKLVADIFNCNIDLSTINDVIQEGSVLIIAVFNNDLEIVKILLESNQIDVNLYELKDGNTALITAIENSNKEIAQLLIEYPKTDINFANKNHQTALTIAVTNQQKEIVDLLIKNDKFDPIKSNINYAFFIANDEIAQLLIDVNELNVNCLMYREINQKKTPYLKSSKQDSCMFESALEYALNKNYINKIKLIVNHPSFDPVKSKVNELIFNDLCMKNIEIFKQFIEIIDNNVNIYSPKGELLLIHAINQGNESIIKEILNNSTFKPNKKEFLISFYLIKEKKLTNLIKNMLDYDQNHDHYLDSDDQSVQVEDYKSNPTSNENKKDASELNSPLLLIVPKLNEK